MRAPRLLDSPAHAARFVSTIPMAPPVAVGQHGADDWNSIATILCRKIGTVQDHAVLLCSLLLGFGCDAYICVGTDFKGETVWVATMEGSEALFWESVSCLRYEHRPAVGQPRYKYQTIGCVFNHKCFYANSQATDAVQSVSFDLADKALWVPMDSEVLAQVPRGPSGPLCAPRFDRVAEEIALEQALKERIKVHRGTMGLPTVWDDGFSYKMTALVELYEAERREGKPPGTDGKDSSWKRQMSKALPEGYRFIACPRHFDHVDPMRITISIVQSQVGKDVLEKAGDMGICVRIYPFPEDCKAVWVMVSAQFQRNN